MRVSVAAARGRRPRNLRCPVKLYREVLRWLGHHITLCNTPYSELSSWTCLQNRQNRVRAPDTRPTCTLFCSMRSLIYVLTFVGLHTDTFESLKSQVQHLKSEHKQVLCARRTAKQVRNMIKVCPHVLPSTGLLSSTACVNSSLSEQTRFAA